MNGIVLSPLLKGLVRKLSSIVDERTASTKNLKGELKLLVADLQTIVAVVEDAELMRSSAPVLNWMKRLQGCLYNVDDLIDELHIRLNQISTSSSSLGFLFPLKSKSYPPLQQIRLDLLPIAEDVVPFSFFHNVAYTEEDIRDPGRFGNREDVIGRETNENAVMDLILKSDERVPVVPIIGPLGIGKTTLARLIYNNQSFCGKNFDRKFFLYLGGYDDILQFWVTLSYEIIQTAPFKRDDGDIKQMKMEIQKLLENKRVLIVLDDLYDSTLQKSVARELIDMLAEGSAVIVTTRSRRAASSIGTTPAYQLQPLSADASFHLFTICAFSSEEILKERMAREFVKFCCGVPLVLRSIASLLFERNTVQEWETVREKLQNNDLINLDECLNSALFYIPPDFRLLLPCFRLAKASCGGLSVECLTCVWMALGFLYSDDTAQTPEYIARKYLKEVAETALCPDVQYAAGGVVRNINFNDALYDWATNYAHQSWAIIRSNKVVDTACVHIIWDQDRLLGTHTPSDCIPNPGNVRLFMVSSTRRRDSSVQFVRNILSSLLHLRVLGLGGCHVEMLPDSIGKLKHLRYLDLGRNPRIKSLPDSICNLWHLQTLLLHGCNQLQELPPNIKRLQNLRYLTLTILKEILPDAIGQLTSLRTLGLTSCPSLASLPSTINNLKNLETLGIVNCPELDLASTSSVEGFKGLDSINTLLLSHLPMFAGLPPDVGNLSVALKHLQIQSCTSLTEAKWIAHFRYLRSLTIEECPQLSDLTLTDGALHLDGLFELVIRSCPSLGYSAWIRQFVSLRSLIIGNCPKLVELDAGFCELKKLERLEIRGCPVLTGWFASPAGKDWRCIAHVRVIEVDGSHL